jgi:hypothetical protein
MSGGTVTHSCGSAVRKGTADNYESKRGIFIIVVFDITPGGWWKDAPLGYLINHSPIKSLGVLIG